MKDPSPFPKKQHERYEELRLQGRVGASNGSGDKERKWPNSQLIKD